jgi:hypothetical protein
MHGEFIYCLPSGKVFGCAAFGCAPQARRLANFRRHGQSALLFAQRLRRRTAERLGCAGVKSCLITSRSVRIAITNRSASLVQQRAFEEKTSAASVCSTSSQLMVPGPPADQPTCFRKSSRTFISVPQRRVLTMPRYRVFLPSVVILAGDHAPR